MLNPFHFPQFFGKGTLECLGKGTLTNFGKGTLTNFGKGTRGEEGERKANNSNLRDT